MDYSVSAIKQATLIQEPVTIYVHVIMVENYPLLPKAEQQNTCKVVSHPRLPMKIFIC